MIKQLVLELLIHTCCNSLPRMMIRSCCTLLFKSVISPSGNVWIRLKVGGVYLLKKKKKVGSEAQPLCPSEAAELSGSWPMAVSPVFYPESSTWGKGWGSSAAGKRQPAYTHAMGLSTQQPEHVTADFRDFSDGENQARARSAEKHRMPFHLLNPHQLHLLSCC